jgi:hypothetical protein
MLFELERWGDPHFSLRIHNPAWPSPFLPKIPQEHRRWGMKHVKKGTYGAA